VTPPGRPASSTWTQKPRRPAASVPARTASVAVYYNHIPENGVYRHTAVLDYTIRRGKSEAPLNVKDIIKLFRIKYD